MKRIDKSEIGMLISDDIKKILKEIKEVRKPLVLEYAESRKELDKYISSITITLMQHWSLVRYCTINDITETKNHWKNEVFNYIFRVASTKIKPSNNRDVVEKMIVKRWFEMEELHDDTEKVSAFIENKFKEENINLNNEEITFYSNEFQKSMKDIIYQMSYGTKDSINEYIRTI